MKSKSANLLFPRIPDRLMDQFPLFERLLVGRQREEWVKTLI